MLKHPPAPNFKQTMLGHDSEMQYSNDLKTDILKVSDEIRQEQLLWTVYSEEKLCLKLRNFQNFLIRVSQ